jgi:predicted sulfurtransferase
LKVVSFYRFLDLEDPQGLKLSLQSLCDEKGLLGTILLAEEGVNGTLAGSREAVEAAFAWLSDTLALEEPVEARWTEAAEAPFRRMRVRLKKEIVTLGRPDVRPSSIHATTTRSRSAPFRTPSIQARTTFASFQSLQNNWQRLTRTGHWRCSARAAFVVRKRLH